MNMPNTLVIVLTEPPSYLLIESEDPSTLILAGRHFVDSGLGKLVGYYDWLHSAEGQLIGVRTRMFSGPKVADVRAAVATNSAVEVFDANVHIYFSSQREFDEALSYDLEYGANRILVAADGVLALTFDTVHLSDLEMSAIRALA